LSLFGAVVRTRRIERGFVRVEDEKPEPEAHAVSGEVKGGHAVNEDGATVSNGEAGDERFADLR
jgi:ParB family transcriptional regulator, chromosome partitioning protein